MTTTPPQRRERDFVEDTASGCLGWRERAVDYLLTVTARARDVILCAKVSRLARSTRQPLEILECYAQTVRSV